MATVGRSLLQVMGVSWGTGDSGSGNKGTFEGRIKWGAASAKPDGDLDLLRMWIAEPRAGDTQKMISLSQEGLWREVPERSCGEAVGT